MPSLHFHFGCTFLFLLIRGHLALHRSTAPVVSQSVEIHTSGELVERGALHYPKPDDRLKLKELQIQRALARGKELQDAALRKEKTKQYNEHHLAGIPAYMDKVSPTTTPAAVEPQGPSHLAGIPVYMDKMTPTKTPAAIQSYRTRKVEKEWLQGWPVAAIAKEERVLLWPEGQSGPKVLAGGTQPEKVLFPEGLFVRKTVALADSSAIMMEALVNDLYAVAGVNTPRCRYYPYTAQVTKDYILCHWSDGWKRLQEMDSTTLYHASAHFVLDAILANYDLWGRRGNFGVDEAGKTLRIDNGGSLAASGLGAWKGTAYNCSSTSSERRETWSHEPFSLWDLRSSGPEVYAHVTMNDIQFEATSILNKKALFLKAVDDFNSTIATAKVKRTLEARLDCLSQIISRRADLLEHVSRQNATLAKEVCEGVREVCRDVLGDN